MEASPKNGLRLDTFFKAMNQPPKIDLCPPGSCPWDLWEHRALEARLTEKLATLGRALMREAYQHNWRPQLQTECGWVDEGEAMLELALSDPKQASDRWEHLLNTDGEIGFYNPETQSFELY